MARREDKVQQEKEQQSDTNGGMTRSDAGSLGGTKTAETYGSEHFREIGRKGGKARGEG